MNLADIVRKVLDGNTYMVLATAGEVPGDDISRLPVVRSVFAGRGRRELTPAELRPPAPYRLYRATVTEHSVLCPRETGPGARDTGWATTTAPRCRCRSGAARTWGTMGA